MFLSEKKWIHPRSLLRVAGLLLFSNFTISYSEGHAWIIDGYKTTTTKNYSYITDAASSGQVNKLISITNSISYLHMNWGWE